MIPIDLIIFILIGGACGFFLKLWLQVAIIVIAVIYYKAASKDDNGNDAHLHLVYWIAFACIGMIIGNLIYVLLHIPPGSFDLFHNFPPDIKDWFIR